MGLGDAPPTRLVLADPHRSFVEALALRLDVEADLEVVGTVGNRDELVRIVCSQPVDVAVLTLGAGVDFLSAVSGLPESRPGMHLLAVGEREDVVLVERALRSGCRGWVPKELGVEALLDGVRAVRRGEIWIPPDLLSRLLPHLLDRPGRDHDQEQVLAALTSRELDVLRAMARGASPLEIAAELAISANTVRSHVQNILTKLGVHTSLAAVALARRSGMG
jgi:DNA-binding NarL/FixJ family response regulator